MTPIGAGVMGAGLVLQTYGRIKANMDQADAEARNASFYREQAQYARETGERQRSIFDNESRILYGEQESAFAKAGVDVSANSYILATTMLSRQKESVAIQKEADFNVRLASLRADASDRSAEGLRDPFNNFLQAAGPILGGASSIL